MLLRHDKLKSHEEICCKTPSKSYSSLKQKDLETLLQGSYFRLRKMDAYNRVTKSKKASRLIFFRAVNTDYTQRD